jgi:hypothetical protein
MFRAKLLLLSLVASLSAVALLASSAAAKIAFEWKVSGKALAAGEERTFTSSAGTRFNLSGSVGGVNALILIGKLKVAPGAKIFGGKPGTNEETVEFENVTADKPSNCEVESLPNPVSGKITTKLLKTEIVEGQTSREPLIFFNPKVGAVFAELRFLGVSCILKNQEVNVNGNILAEPSPQLTEGLTKSLGFEASGKEFFLSAGGAAEKAGLTFGVEPARLTGTALVTLVSDEVFGAF